MGKFKIGALMLLVLVLLNSLAGCFIVTKKDMIKPIITGNKDIYYLIGDEEPNYLNGVEAFDNKEGSVKVTVDDSEVDLTEVGTYKIYYKASDSSLNEAIEENTVFVEKRAELDTEKPVISGTHDFTLYINSEIPDWTDGVTVTDNVSKNIELIVDDSDVKLDEIGNYQLIYSATDEALNEEVVTVSVKVIEKEGEGGGEEEMDEFQYPNNPGYLNSVSCHDPSVYQGDDGKYYTFGSHFAVTSSTDLVRWNQLASDNQSNYLYGAVPWETVLSDALAYINNPGASSTWAPAVTKLNGKYYMYYSLSTFGSSKSYIGRVESNNITGPYSESVEIVKTPGTTNHPNAIDPEIFYDKEGRLWMVYGSFFSGIYIKELYASGENIGLPLDNGYGIKLWQGNNEGPEGPYIFYNEGTDYYYLMVSHGSLMTDYNMRVARSKNPTGPYFDIKERDVAYNSDAGVKLAGNYQFSGYQTGYGALGHNSVIKKDNEYFVIYHSRYKDGSGVSGWHNQYCNKLLFNKDGWPVLSPNNFAFEKLGRVTTDKFIGNYDLLIHSSGNNVNFISSNVFQFDSEGNIKNQSNQVVGNYQIIDDYYITMMLNNVTYKGVITPQWNKDLNKACLSITAINTEGISLWANKK